MDASTLLLELLLELKTLVGAAYVRMPELSEVMPLPADWANRPLATVMPGSVEDIGQVVRAVESAGVSLVMVGGGTQLATGNPPLANRPYLALSLQRLDRILDYQPDDMTITCEPGVTLARVQKQLAARRQFLPLDVALPEQATLGGIVASNQSGFWRLGYGTPRDLVIGTRAIMTDGTEIKGGGKVVKNVAGYDVCKLFTGSWGTVGIITEVTFKVYPLPEGERLLRLNAPDMVTAARAGLAIHHSQLAPTSLIATNEFDTEIYSGIDNEPGRTCLLIRLQGPEDRMDWQTTEMGLRAVEAGLSAPEVVDASLLQALRNTLGRLSAPIPEQTTLAGRIACLPADAAMLLQNLQTIHGIALTVDCAMGIIHFAVAAKSQKPFAHGPSITAAVPTTANLLWTHIDSNSAANFSESASVKNIDRWGNTRETTALLRAMKQTLDPKGTFNPGRFVGGI